ncbi:Serine acetyltransferase [Candidatus Ornithobacterium hominis]|uniref:serine O-acetyltransferase n=1 Tax=Candidatus Ornithobacterium hominis TaxID=2497989 RepID=UPI000E5AB669|nr:serine O-acetyltransferase [Candidatus Ornithobacterium hominis]SZD73335.1 Serine acetyltransferase [Candidatus Ornithobacterium hominis]
MSSELSQNIIKNYEEEYEKVPEKNKLFDWLNDLIQILFPYQKTSEQEINSRIQSSKKLFQHLVLNVGITEENAKQYTAVMYENLIQVHQDLLQDAKEFLKKDPAAQCLGEVLHTYPGFYAIAIYRLAHLIHQKLQLTYWPRMLTEYTHSKTGIDIHPAAEIGVPFLIDHGTGVVIGETCKIGKYVNIYQGVTLGAMQVEKSMQNIKRHPTIEDHVVIYANATILGGSTIIGNHSIIGGNVFLTKSVDPYSIVYTKSDVKVKNIKTENNPINFMI